MAENYERYEIADRITECTIMPAEKYGIDMVTLTLGTSKRRVEATLSLKDLKRLRQIIKQFKKERRRSKKLKEDRIPGIGWDRREGK